MAKYEFTIEEAPEDADYRNFFDSKVLRVWHLVGEEKTLTIEKVERLRTKTDGEEKSQPLLRFRGVKLPLACNKTNAATIAQLYGLKAKDWVGKRITLYSTTTQVGRNTVECIRIRPEKPAAKSRASKHESEPPPPPPDDDTPPDPFVTGSVIS